MTGVTIGVLSAADQAAIRAVTDRFVQLVLAQDFDSLVQLYTEDAAFMPPHHPGMQGRTAIRSWVANFPKASRFDFTIDDIDGRADLAYVRGTFSMTLHPEDVTGSVDEVGKFVEIRKRQEDGSWLIAADIFNSDKP